eukprot:snap_masked-scaffold_31-processed-gene-0.6-mRNA-1 protein AED:0.38 eAED:1.00 QI:0/0/0/1/1/1/2/0/215
MSLKETEQEETKQKLTTEDVKSLNNDESSKDFVVSKHRWFILASFCSLYFFWNFESYRTVPLTAEFALYFSVTNELSVQSSFPWISGVDTMITLENFLLLFYYPLGGYLNDNYGLFTLKISAAGFAVSSWWWVLAGSNYGAVLMSKFISCFSGALAVTSLLRISSQWFPSGQRALAIAIGAVSSVIGAGAGLIVFPGFTSGEDVIDFRTTLEKTS